MKLKTKVNLQIIAGPIIGYFIIGMFRISLGIIIPEVMIEYGLSEAEGGGLITSFLLALAFIVILGGELSDRIGKTYTMSIGFTLMSIGMFLSGYSLGYWMLISVLFISGIGAGIFIAALYTFMGDIMPSLRGTLVGFTNSSFAIGGFLGPLISAMLIMKFNWRSSLQLMGILALILSFVLWFNLRIGFHRERPRKKSNGEFFKLLKNSRLIILCVSFGIGNYAYNSLTTWAPSYLLRIGNLNLPEVGFAFGLLSITGAIGSIFFGILSDRIGRRTSVLISGISASILSFFYFSGYIEPVGLIVLSGVLGFVSYPYWNLMVSAVQDIVDKQLIGSATGLSISLAMLIAVGAPVLTGFLLAEYGFNSALILSVALPQLIYAIMPMKAMSFAKK